VYAESLEMTRYGRCEARADALAEADFILSKELSPFSVVHDAIRVHGDTAVVIDVS
jgi:hypothetical protein